MALGDGEVFEKRCSRCRVIQPVTAFRVDARRGDGRRNTCRFCSEDGRVPISGQCGLCAQPSEDLIADHNHANNLFRDLICRPCNAGLGFFRDDPETLRAAARYVEHHSENPSELTYQEAQKRLRALRAQQ